MRLFGKIVVGAAVAGVLVLAPSARAAATPCQADVRATAMSDQPTSNRVLKVWAVEIDTEAACAKVYVDLTLTETLFNGEEITSTRRGWRTVNAGTTATYKVNYPIASDSSVTDWKFKVARCVVCGTE